MTKFLPSRASVRAWIRDAQFRSACRAQQVSPFMLGDVTDIAGLDLWHSREATTLETELLAIIEGPNFHFMAEAKDRGVSITQSSRPLYGKSTAYHVMRVINVVDGDDPVVRVSTLARLRGPNLDCAEVKELTIGEIQELRKFAPLVLIRT